MSKDSKLSSVLERLKSPLRLNHDNGTTDPTTSTTNGVRSNTPPPAYEAAGPETHEEEPINLAEAFENLSLSNAPTDPTVDTCLAHLKLMFAFQWMKEDVGFTDGLWGLWDSRAGPIEPALKDRPRNRNKAGETSDDAVEGGGDSTARIPSVEERLASQNLKTLSRIREKRWALFVARAVDRYEAWWKSLIRRFPAPHGTVTEYDIGQDKLGSPRYLYFAVTYEDEDPVFPWTEDMLPPLDVLMVWHTHMLNPRAFLEDAIFAGLRKFWMTGLPWDLINKAIDADFNYNVSDECKARWTQETNMPWDSAEGSPDKELPCPRCGTLLRIPWTTCGYSESCDANQGSPNLSGTGYGDSLLGYRCEQCSLTTTRDILSVAKFVSDLKKLGTVSRPMPGTLLCSMTGTPIAFGRTLVEQTFPNRLLKSSCKDIRNKLSNLLTTETIALARLATMERVRESIEDVLRYKEHITTINKGLQNTTKLLPPESRLAIRKMMSRYWENITPFALDLAGAVMRQGVFVEKMCRIDWLHSPAARETMARLLTKYERFLNIMAKHPTQMAVPTLDVDLAWHTNQLTPSRYYARTVRMTGRFVNHDDKVLDDTLSRQFEWTSKVYQQMYGEVYSECTSIRTSHISPVGSALGISTQERVAESFYTSGAASLHPPSNSAHISSHPSVRLSQTTRLQSGPWMKRREVLARLAARHQANLEKALARAKERALKRGRTPPEKPSEVVRGKGKQDEKSKKKDDDAYYYYYYDHWGYPYFYAHPYAYALWWTPGLYMGATPCDMATGSGHTGGCVAGTCTETVANGGCGGAGMWLIDQTLSQGCGGVGAGGAGVVSMCTEAIVDNPDAGDGGGCGGCGGSLGPVSSVHDTPEEFRRAQGSQRQTRWPRLEESPAPRTEHHVSPLPCLDQTSLPQCLSRPPIERSDPALDFNPQSPFHPAMIITPEASLLDPSSSPPAPTSPPRSPNLSTNSSWATYDDAKQPSTLERYIHNHERHEHLALSIHQQRQHDGFSRKVAHVPIPPSTHSVSHAARRPYGNEQSPSETQNQSNYYHQPQTQTPPRATSSTAPHANYDPIQRYLSSPQAHERLACVLDEQKQQQQQPKTQRTTTIFGTALIHDNHQTAKSPSADDARSPSSSSSSISLHGESREEIQALVRRIRERPHSEYRRRFRLPVKRLHRQRECDSLEEEEEDQEERVRVKRAKKVGV
ncbi:hypothetical protein VTJ49DRAFT_3411 [Mycothermus thermophilus]|uniref:Uncharacterized protein n=1 Tax=Humicola insolens TaxID=85995 RepID=A0ABR3V810_HUMIN